MRQAAISGACASIKEYNRRRQVVGTPDQVKARLLDLAAAYDVAELVVVSICYDFAARLHTYELLAEAFELPQQR